MDQGISSAGARGRPPNVGMNFFQRALENIASLLDIRGYRTEMDRYAGELRQRRAAK